MAENNIYVLGLETSCDETAAAIVEMQFREGPRQRCRTHIV